MSGGSGANNSWTILTPEETAAETLKPLAEGTENHEESITSAADEPGSGENPPANGVESAEGLPVEGHLESEDKAEELSGDTRTEELTSVPTAVTHVPVVTSVEVSNSGLVPGTDAPGQPEGLPECPAQSSTDHDSFSDSYTHISPSPEEPPASLLSTETLGGLEFTEEEGTLYPLTGDEGQLDGEESDLSHSTTDVGKQAEEAEPEVRRRRSLLAALERIGRTEEEEGEEEFQLPQRDDDDSGFSVNKCILGAVLLVGLGTIFFSGVFMDLDEESDYDTRELRDAELPGKQEWLNPEVPPPQGDVDNTELLNKLAKGNQQISVLQAQLQERKEELKVANGEAAEGAKERLLREELEKENSRLKKEMTSVPVLQKENEKMKRELESVPALQKELETLRATVTELKLSSAASEAAPASVEPDTSPPSGQPVDSKQGTSGSTESQHKKPWDEKRKDIKKDKNDTGVKKEWKDGKESEWKEGKRKERKDGEKTEWKKEKHEQGKFDKGQNKEGKLKGHDDETKQWKEEEGKKEKASRGDEGEKPWKDRKEGKKEWTEKSGRKDWKEEKKDWKKAKHEKVAEGKQWKGKEEKKGGKEHGEKYKGKEEWKGEKEWKKGKDGKEKWEKKDWKDGKGEKKEWKKDGDWKSKQGKEHDKEGKGKGEKKHWEEGKNHGKDRKWKDENERKGQDAGKEWKRKDERKEKKEEEQWKKGGHQQKKKHHDGDWEKKDRSGSQKHKYSSSNHHEEPSHTHRRPSLDQPQYWMKQRDRIQHQQHKLPPDCNSLETCAKAEGLLPVPYPEFDTILQRYLARAEEEAGVDGSKMEELKKLAAEFFKDGVFVHDQMSFQDFAEDVGDILEDMVEGDEEEEEEEDSAIEEEMEEFEREVMKKFSVPGGAGEKKNEKSKGEWRKESNGRARG